MKKLEQTKNQDRAICLVQQHQGKFNVCHDAIQILKKIEGDIAVLSVCGAYRTGKSYFLNRVVLGRSSGFGVGSTIQACTKGIWMWNQVLKYQDYLGNPINLIVLDTEGLSSYEQDAQADTKLFALTLLLSSMMIYNSMGAIDQNTIDNLAVVSQISKYIEMNMNNGDFKSNSPDFYWVLRDFSLQLNNHGKPISQNEYLEGCLRLQKHSTQQKNQIRKAITSYFKNRCCFTMVRPITKEEDLHKLDKIELQQLRPEFAQQVLIIRQKLISSIKPKKMKDKKLSAQNLCQLLQFYTTAFNRGRHPSIQGIWTHICKTQCHKALIDAANQFQNWLEELLGRLPISQADFHRAQKQIKKSTLQFFSRAVQNNDQTAEYLKQLKCSMKDRTDLLQKHNNLQISRHAKDFFQRQFKHIENKVEWFEITSTDQLIKQLATFKEFCSLHYQLKSTVSDKILSEMIDSKLTLYSKMFNSKLEAKLTTTTQQMYAYKGTITKLESEIVHLKEVEMLNLSRKLSETSNQLQLQQFQNQQLKNIVQMLREQTNTLDERLRKSEGEKIELRKLAQESKLRVGASDQQIFTLKQQLEMLKNEYETSRMLTENKLKFNDQLQQQYVKKQQNYKNDIKRLQQQQEEKTKQLNKALETMSCNYEKAMIELQEQVASNQKMVSKFDIELAEKHKIISQLKQNLKKHMELQQNLQRQLTILSQQRTDKKQRKEQNHEVQKLLQQNLQLKNQIRNLKEALETADSKYKITIQQYEKQISDLTTEIQTIEQNKKTLILQLTQKDRAEQRILLPTHFTHIHSQSPLERQEQIREEYDMNLKNLRKIYDEEKQSWQAMAKEEKQQLHDQISKLTDEMSLKYVEFEEDSKDKQLQIAQLNKKAKQLQKTILYLEITNRQLQRNKQLKQSDTNKLHSQHEEQMKKEKNKVDEMKNKLLIAESKTEDMRNQNMQLTKENLSLKNKIESLEAESKRVRQRNTIESELAEERQEISRKYEELRVKHQKTYEQLIVSKTNLQKELALSHQQNEFLTKRFEDCKKELIQLKQQLSDDQDEQSNQIQQLKKQIQEKTNENVKIKTKLDKAATQIRQLSNIILRSQAQKIKIQEQLLSTLRRNQQLTAFHEQESIYSNEKVLSLEQKLHLTSDLHALENQRLRKQNEEYRLEMTEDRKCIEQLRSQLQQFEKTRKAAAEQYQQTIMTERQQKRQLKQELTELQLKLKALERGEKRSRLERASQSILLEQIELLKKQKDQFLSSSRKDYHQLNELMTSKVEQLEKRLHTEQAQCRKLRFDLQRQQTCFNLAKQNLNDRISQLSLSNDLLSKELETTRRMASTTSISSPKSKFRLRLDDLTQH